jgi:hypothetical protein
MELTPSPASINGSLPSSTTDTWSICNSESPTPCPDHAPPPVIQPDLLAYQHQSTFGASSNLRSELGSRTRKRHRDNRPDEATVFRMLRQLGYRAAELTKEIWRRLTKCIEKTISKLFAAQRRPEAAPILSEDTVAQHNRTCGNQPTLFAFWNDTWDHRYLERAAAPTFANYSLESIHDFELNHCSHCETLLRSSPGANMHVPIDLSLSIQEAFGCANCGKLVCDLCAVEREKRSCLECI